MNDLAVEFNQITNNWFQKATVRHTPRILVPGNSSADHIYPRELVIICDHPLVVEQGISAQSYILTQTAYRFLFGIGLVETRFIIRCTLDLIHNQIKGINEYEKLQALTVLIDEGYHAQVALDYIAQVKSQSGIEPLSEPQSNSMIDATNYAYTQLPENLRMDFQLLAITLAENVLTDEIATIGKNKELEETFKKVMKDHVSDEGRHANYFVNLMKRHWSQLPIETQHIFGKMLPDYLDNFLRADTSREFEREVLQGYGFSTQSIDYIIADTHSRYLSGQTAFAEKTKAKLYRLLKHIGVLDLEENRQAFSGRSYIQV